MIPPTTDTGPTRTPTVRGLLAVALAVTAIPVGLFALAHLAAVAMLAAVVGVSALLGYVVLPALLPAVLMAVADGRLTVDFPGPVRFVLVVED